MNLTHSFLIAMPSLDDSFFGKGVILICEHNDEGAFGLLINKPLDLTLRELLEQTGLTPTSNNTELEQPVFLGGPVQMERGFILHHGEAIWQASRPIMENLTLTTSRDILEAIATGEFNEKTFATLGYSGWGAGQLENELADNAWLTVQADLSIIFDVPPKERHEAALRLLGVDPMFLWGGSAGHA